MQFAWKERVPNLTEIRVRGQRREEKEVEREREEEGNVSSTTRSTSSNDPTLAVGCGLINRDDEMTPATFSYSKMLQRSLGGFSPV